MVTSLAQGGHQVSLNSLARVIVGVRISLDFFLVGQGRDCAITITYAAFRGNALHHVERSIQTLNDNDGLWDLFSWLDPGPRGCMVKVNIMGRSHPAAWVLLIITLNALWDKMNGFDPYLYWSKSSQCLIHQKIPQKPRECRNREWILLGDNFPWISLFLHILWAEALKAPVPDCFSKLFM